MGVSVSVSFTCQYFGRAVHSTGSPATGQPETTQTSGEFLSR